VRGVHGLSFHFLLGQDFWGTPGVSESLETLDSRNYLIHSKRRTGLLVVQQNGFPRYILENLLLQR